MSISVKPEGHLLERKLGEYLKKIVDFHDNCEWLGAQFKIEGYRYRYDFAFSRDETKYLVEFDGPEHYQNSIKIKTDWEKDFLAEDKGFKIVRIPYFIQFTNQMFMHWFGFDAEILEDGDFSHGFITTNILPASFCPLGEERFHEEIINLPKNVWNIICESLDAQVDKLIDKCVSVDPELCFYFIYPFNLADSIYKDLKSLEKEQVA